MVVTVYKYTVNNVRYWVHFIRSTLRQSRPNKAGLKCSSVRTYVRTSVRPQRFSSISMKFGL